MFFADFLVLFMDRLGDRMNLFVNEYSLPYILGDMCLNQINEKFQELVLCVETFIWVGETPFLSVLHNL